MEDILLTTNTPDEAPKDWPIALGFLKLYGIDGKGGVSPSSFGNMGSEGTLLPPDTGENGRRLLARYGSTDIILHPGVYLVSGGSGMGKTHFVRHLTDTRSYAARLITFKEPERHSLYKESEVMQAVSSAMADGVNLLAIDSIRTILYASLGGTAAGGVSMGVYDLLTTWDIFAQRIGMTIMMTINPLTVKAEVIQQLFEASMGSVTAVYQFTGRGQFTYTSRRDPDGQRQVRQHRFRTPGGELESSARNLSNIPPNARSI